MCTIVFGQQTWVVLAESAYAASQSELHALSMVDQDPGPVFTGFLIEVVWK